MHAGGRLGPRLSREGFRRARRRFLDDISTALGPDRSGQATIVFDASVHPGDFAIEAHYRGLGILFALGDENADARIERLIAADSNPRTLTVVSSDRRIRQAADRRKSRSVTADQFWELIDDLNERRQSKPKVEAHPSSFKDDGHLASDDRAYWLEAFHDIDEMPGLQEALKPHDSLLTDDEIAEIERQVRGED